MTELKRMNSSRYGISRVLTTNWLESNVIGALREGSGERFQKDTESNLQLFNTDEAIVQTKVAPRSE